MFKNYLKMAVKVLLRRKFFTFISLFGIAVTLVVLMVAAALLDHVLGPHSPEINASRTLGVYLLRMQTASGSNLSGPPSSWFLEKYVKTLPGVETVSLHSVPTPATTFVRGAKIRSSLKGVDPEFWKFTRFEFIEGGPFSEQDFRDVNRVAVINHSYKRRYFGNRSAVGQWIEVNHERYRVTGVVRDVPLLRLATFADVWIPASVLNAGVRQDRQIVGGFMASIMAHSRADFPAVKAEFQARLKTVDLPESYVRIQANASTPFELIYWMVVRDSDESHPGLILMILIGLAVLFMTLPAVNLVNINMSRILERASEIGVRRSFGASARSLVGQFIVENVVLCLVGGAIGFLLSFGVLQLISYSGIIPHASFQLNLRLFGYAFLMSLTFALLSGVYPAWHMSRLHPVEALKKSAL